MQNDHVRPFEVWLRWVGLSLAGGALVRVAYLLGRAAPELPLRHRVESAALIAGAGFLVLLSCAQLLLPPGDRVTRGGPGRGRWIGLVLWIAGFSTYAWALTLGPLSDDYVLRAWAESDNYAPSTWPYLRPLPLLIWKGISLAGGDWLSLHALNAAVHGANAALVGMILLGRVPQAVAVFSGLCFGIFPAAAEAVAWTAGVFDVLSTFWLLLAVLVLTRARPGPVNAATTTLLIACGLLSKETAVSAAAILPATVFALCSPHELKRRTRDVLVPAGLAAFYAVARIVSSSSASSHVHLPTSRVGLKDLVVRPYSGVLAPYRIVDGQEPVALLGAAALVVILATGLWGLFLLRNRHESQPSLGLLGLSWIAFAAAPLTTQFFVAGNLEGSRYLYLPSVGLAMFLGWCMAVSSYTRFAPTAKCAGAALLIVYVVAGASEAQRWRSAADVRHSILEQTRAIVSKADCGSITVSNAPSDLDGVHLFREGLSEALSRVMTVPGGRACQLEWGGGELHLSSP